MGYMLSCSSPLRAAYGWQRDGGHAEYLLAEENCLVALPDELTYLDGALVACGFGTVVRSPGTHEASRAGIAAGHRAGPGRVWRR